MKLSEEGFVIIDIRIGRLNKIDDYLKKYPERLNEKIFPSEEFGSPKNHSALELSVLFGHQSILRWLVKKGAHETMETSPNLLVFAVNQQNEEMIKTLGAMGFDPWASSPISVTPICLAAALGWDRGLSVWRQSGISLKKRTSSGGTLFHDVLERAHSYPENQTIHLCKYLFGAGVKWGKNKEGRAPFDIANPLLKKETIDGVRGLLLKNEAQKSKKKLTKSLAAAKNTPTPKKIRQM